MTLGPLYGQIGPLGVASKRLAPYADRVLSYTPLAYYKLIDASGNFTDSSGNGYTASAVATSTRQDYALPGASMGSCARFNVSGNLANAILNASVITGLSLTAGTVCGWYRRRENAAAAANLFDWRIGGMRIQVRIDSAYTMVAQYATSGVTPAVTQTMAIDTWYFILLTWSGGNSASFYIDGALVAGPTAVATYTPAPSSGRICATGSASTGVFYGNAGHFAVFNRTADAAMIADLALAN